LTPASVRKLCAHGLSALVQSGAGAAIGLSDALHQSAGAVARTSTFALNNATLAHAVALADKGWKQARSQHQQGQNRSRASADWRLSNHPIRPVIRSAAL